MSVRKNNPTQGSPDREIVITRLLDAPRPLVFEAWTKPQHISHWWGPRGFRTTIHEMNVKTGGVWRFIMHGPDGTDYPNRIVYEEVLPGERLVYLHGGDDDWKTTPPFHVTITFADEAGRTRVTMRSVFASPGERDKVIKFGAVEGGNQTLDRLGEHVATLGAVIPPFVISREFAAPRALVFNAWTEREHLVKWWGPKGAQVVHCRNDLRPGGTMHYGMRMPDGREIWGRWVYRDIIPPERLVFVNSFSDEAGGITRHPFAPEWPLELLSTITFTEKAGRTTVTVQWVPIDASESERKTFDGGRTSMQGGWGGTLDQFAEYLAHTGSMVAK